MRSSFLYITVLLPLLCFNSLFAQNETKAWYFGQFAALDFNPTAPTNPGNGAMLAEEGCASVAGANGSLIFYTNGEKIYNASHQLMANGNGLAGELALSQNVLIAKQPGSTTQYYVFTANRGISGFRYSIVDMSLAAGQGSVTAKNVWIDSASTLRVCGVKHCNGNDIWIITHDNFSDRFKARLLSSAGLNTLAVVSDTGSYVSGKGCMKVSPNGKKLAQAIAFPYSVELFDFDASTGLLGNSVSLPAPGPAYGCEFSPDGTKLYGSMYGLSGATERLMQWDLCSGTGTAIAASAYTFNSTHTGQLQLAANGSIYQARASIKRIRTSPESSIELLIGEPYLGVIYNPNAAANAVFYNSNGQSVSPSLSLFGLPNLVSGYYKSPQAQFTYSINPAVNCSKVLFTAPPLINATCSATSYTVNNVLWMFGDASSPSLNTSTLLNPDHVYPGVGSYDVKLVMFNACGGVIDTLRQIVQVGGALLNSPKSLTLCTGKSITLQASGPNTYTWSTGAIGNSIVVSPTVNTTYSVGFTDTFGCNYQSVATVTVFTTPTILVTGKDSLCETQTATLSVSGALTYSWSTGSTNASIKVTPSVTTVYDVSGYSLEGCRAQLSKTVAVKVAPVPVITGNTVVCLGNAATVVAQANGNITWNNGAVGPTLTVIPEWNGMYVFSATAKYANGCSRFERVRFRMVPFPEVKISGSPSLCLGSSISLSTTVVGAPVTYSWSNGGTTPTVQLTPSVSTLYSVVVTNTDNCASTATTDIYVNPTSPDNSFAYGSDTLCAGESTTLSAAGGAEFNWNPLPVKALDGYGRVEVTPSVSTLYTVVISTNGDCAVSRTVQVVVNPKPELWLGNDTVFSLQEPMFLFARGTGSVTWIKGDGISCVTCARTQIFPSQKSTYEAITINEYGCVNRDEVTVDIGDELGIYVPSGFTPNGDGINDVLKVRGFGIVFERFTVFNRWGMVVFSSGDIEEGWNGQARGSACETGTYTWLLQYRPENGTSTRKAGFVNLLR